jgi:hypothetical protein
MGAMGGPAGDRAAAGLRGPCGGAVAVPGAAGRPGRAAGRLCARSGRGREDRALHHTYLRSAATQQAAADLLDLPMSTFRRHLAEGVARLTDLLWQRARAGSG